MSEFKKHLERRSRLGLRPVTIAFVLLVIVVGASLLMTSMPKVMGFVEVVKIAANSACDDCYLYVRANAYSFLRDELFEPISYFMVALIMFGERLIPASVDQKQFSVGLRQDLLWLFTNRFLFFGVFAWYYQVLSVWHEENLSFSVAPWLDELPFVLHVAIVFLASDFLHWLHHVIRHKVRIFWSFHAVHHSQVEMNFLTDARVHPIERFVAMAIRFIPFVSLGSYAILPTTFAWFLFTTWYTRIYHGNIRSNFGPLRYILVTPQYHRIHHSSAPEHQDKNFGVIFTIWDYLFGTQYRKYDEYPSTGITDENFPHESDTRSTIVSLVAQFFYPFKDAFYVLSRRSPPRLARTDAEH